MFVVLNYTNVLRLQSIGNNVACTICYQIHFILHSLLYSFDELTIQNNINIKGINQNYLCDLSTNQHKFTTLLLGHCERTVSVVLGIYLSVGNYQQTHTYLSLHFQIDYLGYQNEQKLEL